ncbi:hypothetical protein K8R14_04255 [bacterium]|nr:hypothetical protein [bacterium]
MTEKQNIEQYPFLPPDAAWVRDFLAYEMIPKWTPVNMALFVKVGECHRFLLDVFCGTLADVGIKDVEWILSQGEMPCPDPMTFYKNWTEIASKFEENIKFEPSGNCFKFSLISETSEHKERLDNALEGLGLSHAIDVVYTE